MWVATFYYGWFGTTANVFWLLLLINAYCKFLATKCVPNEEGHFAYPENDTTWFKPKNPFHTSQLTAIIMNVRTWIIAQWSVITIARLQNLLQSYSVLKWSLWFSQFFLFFHIRTACQMLGPWYKPQDVVLTRDPCKKWWDNYLTSVFCKCPLR